MNVRSGLEALSRPGLRFVDRDLADPDRDLAAGGHRITRVHDQVHDHLFELSGVDLDPPALGRLCAGHLDALAEDRTQHRREITNRLAQLQHPRLQHLLATEREQLPFNSGRVHYEVGANTDAMSFGGIGAVHRLVTKLGLPERIDAKLELLKVHLPYHESDHVLNLAYNVLCGGTRLEDIERLRHDTAYMNALGADLIPDPTTTGDFCRRFTEEDVITLMECVNAVRAPLWRGRGRELLGPVAYIDIDGTLAPTTGKRKQGMDISYKGIWGYHPLVVSLANTKEVLCLVNRPGNVPSHTDAAPWIDRAIDHVEPHSERICLRGDADFSLTAHFDRWAKRVDFIITTRTDLSAAEVVRCANERCDQENVIEQLKNGVNALRMPLYDLVSNWAYMVIAALAWNIKSWFAMMMHLKRDRSEYLHMEFRRFLHSVILIPCRVTRRARGITIRLLGYPPTLDRFFSAWRTIERTGFG